MNNVIYRRSTCRGCGSNEMDLVLSLKPSPIGDAFITEDKLVIDQPKYPIDLYMCKICGLGQLTDVINPNILYGDYIYVTTSSSGLGRHFESYAKDVIERCNLSKGALIVDIGSNDGILLKHFQRGGMEVLGIEPALHIAERAAASGVHTLGEFFSPLLAKKIVEKYGLAKIVTANNVFANVDDLESWVLGVNTLLADDGVFIFESYYLADLLKNMVFDFLYHEHLSAFAVKPVLQLFKRVGLELVATVRVDTKGGSLRYFVQRPKGPVVRDGSVETLLEFEEKVGLYRIETYDQYAKKIELLKNKTVNFLKQAKNEGKKIAGYGASVTGTTLLFHFEMGEYLEYLVDDNISKQGRFSPGYHLHVLPSSVLIEKKPDYVVILAWRFASEIIAKNDIYIKNGGKFIIPAPEFQS